MKKSALPIDAHLAEVTRRLGEAGALVLSAEPGAGKTTRVPAAILDAGVSGEIIVLEPRRLAARLSAERVAAERGGRVGDEVGYTVRFEDRSGPRTRLRFVTEGIFTRRLATDPRLDGVGTVILDEFHERHLHGDLALAFSERLRRGARPDLRVVVMSATLDIGAVSGFLGVPALEVEGRVHPVEIHHQEAKDDRFLEQQVASALRRTIADGPAGDVLVFLPGAGEIRRAREACADIAARAGMELVALHGDLPPKDQDRAIRKGDRPKVILSTNVAETSVTIEGVVAVIDSGLARVARHSPFTGLPTLEVRPISQASAKQRAGRAGRMRPGVCVRLYTQHDHDTRPAHDAPDIARADLSETALMLRALGEDPAAFPYFEAPPPAALNVAESLLVSLAATTPSGEITPDGLRMSTLPVHPRLARLLLSGEAAGVASQGALLAALLSEREIRRSARTRFDGPEAKTDDVGSSDLLARRDAFEGAEHEGLSDGALRRWDLDRGATLAVAKARDQILRALRPSRDADRVGDPREEEEALLLATLSAFPDRVGKRRTKNGDAVVFAGGGSGRLAPTSVVKEAELLVALEVSDSRRGPPLIRVASAVAAEQLLELFPDRVAETESIVFEPETERVVRVRALSYDGLVLDESRALAEGPRAAEVLARAAVAQGLGKICDLDALERVRRRAAFAASHDASIPTFDDETLTRTIAELCEGAATFDDLRASRLPALLLASLPTPARKSLDALAPDTVAIPGRPGGVPVGYEPDRPPFIASRLQDFFGLTLGPTIARGAVPLVLHLNAPNGRAVQVTTDLAGFWERHYPTIAKELRRRYPRHHWPDDPKAASPRKPGR
jgi:ATP-dependent helicase HrpB